MRKIQVYIEHDIIIRHFLLNGMLQKLEENYLIQYVFPDYKKRVSTDIESLGLQDTKIISVDIKRVNNLRETSKIKTIQLGLQKPSFRFIINQWFLLFGLKRIIKMIIKSFFISRKIKNLKKKFIVDLEVENAISSFNPDIIIHPCVLEGLFITDLCEASQDKGIPLIVLMNSWDNPSTKAMVLGKPDLLAVWGEQTKQHAINFMELEHEKVITLGSSQFEVFKKKVTKTRFDICKLLNISEDKKLIIYAGSSKSINEIDHLKVLESAIEKGDLPNFHIIFRPHPWRAPSPDEPDFNELRWKHVSIDPFMADSYNTNRSDQKDKINLSDYMNTHNILECCDLLISNVSTILLEAALHDKPTVCMVSDEDIKGSNFLKAVLNSLYFKELLEKLDIPRCSKHRDLSQICLKELDNYRPGVIKEKTKFFVGNQDESYFDGLKKIIEASISNRQTQ